MSWQSYLSQIARTKGVRIKNDALILLLAASEGTTPVKRRWTNLLMLCPLAGCARFEAKPLSLERTAEVFESRTLDDSSLEEFLQENRTGGLPNWPVQEWDLNLLTLAAFCYHPDMETSRAKLAAARGPCRGNGNSSRTT